MKEDILQFPAVTICNHNKIHCGNIANHITSLENDTGTQIELLCKLYFLGKCRIVNIIAEKFETGSGSTTEICTQFQALEKAIDKQTRGKPVFVTSNTLNSLISKLSLSDFYAIAHYPNQLIRDCSYQNDMYHPSCKELKNGVTRFKSPTRGICYSFNYYPSTLKSEVSKYWSFINVKDLPEY